MKSTLTFGGCLIVLLWAYTLVSEIVNLVKLVSLALDPATSTNDPATVKHLVIHGIGLIPGVSWVTCWY